MNISLLKKMLPGLIPLFVFIAADEIWGTTAGLITALITGTAELAINYFKNKTFDRFILIDTLLLILLGIISIILENEIFFKIKPALIEGILVIIIVYSLYGPRNLILLMAERYTGELTPAPEADRAIRLNLKIMLILITVHIVLIFYSAWFMSSAAWAFISGGLFYIIFGIWFATMWIINIMKTRRYRKEEWFPVVDPDGKVIGSAPRSLCHDGKSKLLHPVVHLHLINRRGEIFLQKRSPEKDIQPGKWDTSVGGHIAPGENIENALKREAREEIGINDFNPVLIRKYVWESESEKELVFSFVCISDAKPEIDMVEAVEGKFWTADEIEKCIGKNIFTPNFENEYRFIKEKFKLIDDQNRFIKNH